MFGKVRAMNKRRGFIAVEVDEEYSILEIVDSCEVERGDTLRGNLDSLGSETVFNVTQNEEMEVIIQYVDLSQSQVHRYL